MPSLAWRGFLRMAVSPGIRRGGTPVSGGWQGSQRRSELPPGWYSDIRPRILRRDPWCKARGCQMPSTQVDHIRRGNDHRDTNLQGLCDYHHGQKTSAEGNDAQRAIRAMRYRPKPKHPGFK